VRIPGEGPATPAQSDRSIDLDPRRRKTSSDRTCEFPKDKYLPRRRILEFIHKNPRKMTRHRARNVPIACYQAARMVHDFIQRHVGMLIKPREPLDLELMR
jgi:hypothetical protein